jgi:hypothetical protein
VWWRKSEYPEKTTKLVASHWQTLLHNVVHIALLDFRFQWARTISIHYYLDIGLLINKVSLWTAWWYGKFIWSTQSRLSEERCEFLHKIAWFSNSQHQWCFFNRFVRIDQNASKPSVISKHRFNRSKIKSESEWCVRVEWHVYPRAVVSVS